MATTAMTLAQHVEEAMLREQKIRDTYEEVAALKSILENLLNCDDADRSTAMQSMEMIRPTAHFSPTKSPCAKQTVIRLPIKKSKVSKVSRRLRIHQAPPKSTEDMTLETNVSTEDDSIVAHDASEDTMIVGTKSGRSYQLQPRFLANKTSEALLRNSRTYEPNFQARMRYYLLKEQQRKAEMKQMIQQQEADKMQPTPCINARSKRIGRNVSHLLHWEHEKQNKLAQLRHQEALREAEACVGHPEISSQSIRLFTKRNDDLAHCRVEDRLQLLGLIYEYQQEERKRQEAKERKNQQARRPLAPHSANLARPTRSSVFERLYQRAQQRLQARARRAEETSAKIERQRRTQVDVEAAITRLQRVGQEYKRRHHDMRQQQERQCHRLRNGPKLIGKSRRLMLKTKTTSTHASHRKCLCCTKVSPTEEERPRRVDAALAASIYQKQVAWKQTKETKAQLQKQQEDAAEMMECTFRNPYYQAAWNALRDDSTSSPTDEAAFFQRCMQWADAREQQLVRERALSTDLEMLECTFHPMVHSLSSYQSKPKTKTKTKKSSGKQQPLSPLASPFFRVRPPPSVLSFQSDVQPSFGSLLTTDAGSPRRRPTPWPRLSPMA